MSLAPTHLNPGRQYPAPARNAYLQRSARRWPANLRQGAKNRARGFPYPPNLVPLTIGSTAPATPEPTTHVEEPQITNYMQPHPFPRDTGSQGFRLTAQAFVRSTHKVECPNNDSYQKQFDQQKTNVHNQSARLPQPLKALHQSATIGSWPPDWRMQHCEHHEYETDDRYQSLLLVHSPETSLAETCRI